MMGFIFFGCQNFGFRNVIFFSETDAYDNNKNINLEIIAVHSA